MMRSIRVVPLYLLTLAATFALGCYSAGGPQASQPAVQYFKVDPATAGTIHGTIHFTGKKPVSKLIDMSEDPACVEAHKGKAYDESLVVGPHGVVANAFVYIEKGFEGKAFETPSTAVLINQQGCWFRPRVLGIQTGQPLEVVNSDPVTHNIHPMASMNREWNHSQGPGDDPITRKFTRPEIMISVKCNIHSWMHAFIGVLDHPYFATTGEDGAFTLPNLPPGTYTVAVWQEKLGTTRQQITVTPGHGTVANFVYRGQ
jgi:plastocyanin